MLEENFSDLRSLLDMTQALHSKTINSVAEMIISTVQNKGKIIVIGNGGSYADAMHFAGELEGAYRNRKRPALPALVPSNAAALTAIANDFGYEDIFKKFVEANMRSCDILIGLSTSGNSVNVLKAFESAKKIGAKVVAFTGQSGGKMKDCADVLLNVPSENTPRIQEVHHFAYHEICDIVEQRLFG